MRVPVCLTIAVLLAASSLTLAEGLRIEPGRWEFTSTTPNPLGGGPVRNTSSDCVTDEEMKPQFFSSQMQGCTVSDERSNATSSSWTLKCTTPVGSMTGKGSFRSTGRTLSGSMDVSMNVSGQSFESKSSWEGRRTGDCP